MKRVLLSAPFEVHTYRVMEFVIKQINVQQVATE
jgi:hypothetical protein